MSPRAAFFWGLFCGVGALRHGRKEATQIADGQLSVEGDEIATVVGMDENLTSQGRCNYGPFNRNSYVRCNSNSCRLPEAFQIADAFGKTQLQSYARMSDLKWSGGSWYDYVTRMSLDSNYNGVRKKCSCSPSCDERFDWAKRTLAKVTKCKYPGGYWKKLFAVLNPKSTYTRTQSVQVGRTFSREQSFTEEVGMSVGVAIEGFSSSTNFKTVASQASSRTWNRVVKDERSWKIDKGYSVVVWHYVLSCVGFNSVDMPIQKVFFETDIEGQTSDLYPPTCNPNNPATCSK